MGGVPCRVNNCSTPVNEYPAGLVYTASSTTSTYIGTMRSTRFSMNGRYCTSWSSAP